jgi:hypothetical protein
VQGLRVCVGGKRSCDEQTRCSLLGPSPTTAVQTYLLRSQMQGAARVARPAEANARLRKRIIARGADVTTCAAAATGRRRRSYSLI